MSFFIVVLRVSVDFDPELALELLREAFRRVAPDFAVPSPRVFTNDTAEGKALSFFFASSFNDGNLTGVTELTLGAAVGQVGVERRTTVELDDFSMDQSAKEVEAAMEGAEEVLLVGKDCQKSVERLLVDPVGFAREKDETRAQGQGSGDLESLVAGVSEMEQPNELNSLPPLPAPSSEEKSGGGPFRSGQTSPAVVGFTTSGLDSGSDDGPERVTALDVLKFACTDKDVIKRAGHVLLLDPKTVVVTLDPISIWARCRRPPLGFVSTRKVTTKFNKWFGVVVDSSGTLAVQLENREGSRRELLFGMRASARVLKAVVDSGQFDTNKVDTSLIDAGSITAEDEEEAFPDELSADIARKLVDPYTESTFMQDAVALYLNRHFSQVLVSDSSLLHFWRRHFTSPWQPITADRFKCTLEELGIAPDFWLRNRNRLSCDAITFDVSSSMGFVDVGRERALNFFTGFQVARLEVRVSASPVIARTDQLSLDVFSQPLHPLLQNSQSDDTLVVPFKTALNAAFDEHQVVLLTLWISTLLRVGKMTTILVATGPVGKTLMDIVARDLLGVGPHRTRIVEHTEIESLRGREPAFLSVITGLGSISKHSSKWKALNVFSERKTRIGKDGVKLLDWSNAVVFSNTNVDLPFDRPDLFFAIEKPVGSELLQAMEKARRDQKVLSALLEGILTIGGTFDRSDIPAPPKSELDLFFEQVYGSGNTELREKPEVAKLFEANGTPKRVVDVKVFAEAAKAGGIAPGLATRERLIVSLRKCGFDARKNYDHTMKVNTINIGTNEYI